MDSRKEEKCYVEINNQLNYSFDRRNIFFLPQATLLTHLVMLITIQSGGAFIKLSNQPYLNFEKELMY